MMSPLVSRRPPRPLGMPLDPSVVDLFELGADVGFCASCRQYAWNERQKPAYVGGSWHHPACSVAGSSARVGLCTTASGADLVSALQDAVNQLDRDVQMDACGDAYGPSCKGTSPAVDTLEQKLADAEAEGQKLDANLVLSLAGIPTTPANISAFGACVKQREDATAAVPRGTLAYCAISIHDATSGAAPLLPKAHTTSAWRDRWETFRNSFAMFADKYATAQASTLSSTPSEDEISKQLTLYLQYRSQFLAAGGATTAPCLSEPWSITTTVVVLGSVGLGIYFLIQLLLKKL